MQTISATELGDGFSRILDAVERGESVVITRHGKPIARVNPEGEVLRERARLAAERMAELRKRIGKLSLEEILSARDEGRM